MLVYINLESCHVDETGVEEAKATATGIPNQTLRGLHHRAHEESSEHIFSPPPHCLFTVSSLTLASCGPHMLDAILRVDNGFSTYCFQIILRSSNHGCCPEQWALPSQVLEGVHHPKEALREGSSRPGAQAHWRVWAEEQA